MRKLRQKLFVEFPNFFVKVDNFRFGWGGGEGVTFLKVASEFYEKKLMFAYRIYHIS